MRHCPSTKTRAFIVCFAAIATAFAHADDVKLSNGDILKNAKITGEDALGITFTHSSGIRRVPYDMLPPELQQRFNPDPAKAREQAQAEARAATQRARAEQAFRDQQAREQEEAQISAELDKAAVTITGKVLSVAPNGLLLTRVSVKIRAVKDVVVWRNPLDGSPRYARQLGFDTISAEEPIFVYGAGGLVDGDFFSAVVYPAPHYSYTAASNAAKTVRAFAASKALCRYLFEHQGSK